MADLPSGAVTFLFTDIEGSTHLVKQLRGLYGEVLAEHQRLLRKAFEAHDGHEIDTQGDAFFIAFASAREAVLAAVEGQRALTGYPWPDNAAVKVRMGIHTGQAVPVNGRYTGVAVHRASRICNAGHGGQVLISQATQTLLEDEEEDLEVGLRDLGQQRLKDLDRPVQLYQIAAPGLGAQFPPLREDAPPEAAVAAPAPLYRRPYVLVGAGLALLALIAAVALLATRSGGRGLSGVQPNHVGIIDPESGDIVDEVQVGIRPEPVAVGGDKVWVGNVDEHSMTPIDAATRERLANVSLDNRTPTGIAADDRRVWVANGILGSLQLVNQEFSGQVTDTIEDADAAKVTLGDGSVWTVRESSIARINPGTAEVTGRSFASSGPNAIAFGARALWVSNAGSSDVWRFNPTTFEEEPVITRGVGEQPVAITYGEGAVWVACAGDDTVWRIDPSTHALAQTDVGRNPTAIAAGGGAVWVASGDDGTISKIDPDEVEVVDTIETGNYPAGLAYGEGYVWVTVQEPLAPVG